MRGYCCQSCGDTAAAGAPAPARAPAPAPARDHGPSTGTILLEAEDGQLTGGAQVQTSLGGYHGSGYVGNLVNANSGVTVTARTSSSGLYTLVARYAAPDGDKQNNLVVNGQSAGSMDFPSSASWSNANLGVVFLQSGDNTISLQKDWGYVDIDYFRLTPKSSGSDSSTINPDLVNPNPHPNAKKLYDFIRQHYRKKVISGQTVSSDLAELTYIQSKTGKQPALAGFEFENYSPVSGMADDGTLGRLSDWFLHKNGIPEVQWHWCSPMGATQEWWKSFYTDMTTFDVEKAVTPGTEENRLALRDLDVIASKFKTLQDQGVPVLWRPLHEAEGGWFWWGAKGPKPCVALYRIMYNKFVHEHGLTNLIWVWVSGTAAASKEWYPGDDVVDIIGADIYAPSGNYGPSTASYYQLSDLVQGKKMVALLENGPIPNPSLIQQQQAYWSWFMTWSGYFITDGVVNSVDDLKKFYNDPFTITLSDLPKWN